MVSTTKISERVLRPLAAEEPDLVPTPEPSTEKGFLLEEPREESEVGVV